MKTQNKKSALFGGLMALSVAIMAPGAHAGTFSTGNYSTAGDLGLNSNTGIIDAHYEGAAPVTVGAVTFLAPSTQFWNTNTGNDWANATFADANLSTLSNAWALTFSFLPPATGTIGSLVVGHQYQVQFIIYDGDSNNESSGLGEAYRGDTTVTINGDTLTYNDYVAQGSPSTFQSNVGTYLDYSFTATSTSISASFAALGATANSGTGTFVLSGYDVRDVTAVPEPGTVSALLMGLSGLAGVRFFRRKSSV